MKKLMSMVPIIMLILLASCSKTGIGTQTGSKTGSEGTESLTSTGTNGNHGAIPAYYDSMIFTIHFSEFSPQAEASLIAHNRSLNFIYRSDPGLPGGKPFISVIDAIQKDGFNPIWREVQIRFNAGFTPRQLFSDNGVAAAASGINPEISLDTLNEVYWCPVVGPK